MPDTPWQSLDTADFEAYEAEFQDPDNTYGSPTRTVRTEETRPDGSRVTTVTLVIASSVTVKGDEEDDAFDLIHKCNRCDGHDHSLRSRLGFTVDVPYTPLHVADNKFGQGRGTLFSSVTVTGHLIRRVETRTRPPGGGAPQVDFKWESKTLDHVEQRDLVVLEEFDAIVDCTLGVQESSLSYFVPETGMFAMALARVPGLAEDVGWSDEGRVLPALEEALKGVNRPLFRFSDSADGPEMVLVARTDEGVTELGRVAMDISPDGKRVVAKRYRSTKRK